MTVKEYLRSELKCRRREYYQSLSDVSLSNIENKFIAKLFSLPIFKSPTHVIGCYYSVRDEAPTIRMIQALWQKGFQVALPYVHKDRSMTFHAFQPGDQLEVTTFSIPQPSKDSPVLIPKVMIVPMLGFNREGHRIGYGQGHYDRALKALQTTGGVTTIGLAFTCQEVSDIFVEEYDIDLDWIITETELIQRPQLMHTKRML